LWNNPRYIDEFLASSAADNLSDAERQSVSDWGKIIIKGKFLIHKHLKDYSVFQSFEQGGDNDKLYGVCGITNTISTMLGGKTVPLLVDAVLLPFNGKIIYDTFMAPYSISFSGNVKENFAQFYKESSSKYGIITSL
jgi:hypothetical protein